MLRGLPALQRRLASSIGSQKLHLAPTPWVDGTPPELDQHEPSHSRTLQVINDALLIMMDYML
jgi:hypothetical protein